MPHVILGHRTRMPANNGEILFAAHNQQFPQLRPDHGEHLIIREVEEFRLHCSTDKCAEQDTAIGGASWKFSARKRDSQNLAFLNRWNNQPKRVERMCDVTQTV